MIPLTREEEKKEAFRLFEDGRYRESLQSCTRVLETGKDPAVEVLSATNLFYTGNLEDAEVCFRDLAQKMPESSYVHSYLARVLEARSDDGAVAEYAAAIHLDPNNQDALRSYAGYLLSRQDCRGALPVLRRLVSLGKKESDAKNLVRALIGIGEPREALAAHCSLIGEHVTSSEYLDALLLAQEYRAAAEGALEAYHRSGETAYLKTYLAALAHSDPAAALDAYERYAGTADDDSILADFALLLSARGNGERALDAAGRLLSRSDAPAYRMLACELKAAHGRVADALSGYEALIGDELKSKNDLDLLARIIRQYRTLLTAILPPAGALARFLSVVSADPNIASLLETARFYESLQERAEARSWYYRAYRADFLNGGLEYARILAEQDDMRECEKVMLYILSNVKRTSDLCRVAAVIVDPARPIHRLRRLMDRLIQRLDERRMGLSTEGLELLAASFLIAARHALEDADYAACKRFCLRGIDVQPAQTRLAGLDAFHSLVRVCKEQSIADRPVMEQKVLKKREPRVSALQQIREGLDLDEPEQKILEFLSSHKKATEVELRKALSTRRISGLVNRLIQKAAARNMTIIVKKGVGDDGEVYEYAGG